MVQRTELYPHPAAARPLPHGSTSSPNAGEGSAIESSSDNDSITTEDNEKISRRGAEDAEENREKEKMESHDMVCLLLVFMSVNNFCLI